MVELGFYGVLRVESRAVIPVYVFREMLAAVEYAYNYLYVAQLLMNTPPGEGRWTYIGDSETPRRYGSWVPRRDRLILKSANLSSPGFLEFLGSIFSLEQIRLYLQDRHERRKDKKYREDAEERGLILDNDLKEAKLIQEQIKIAKSLGATDEDLKPLLQRFVRRPLAELDWWVDQGLLRDARVRSAMPDELQKIAAHVDEDEKS